MNYVDHNREVIGSWVAGGWEWSIPMSHEEYLRAKEGDYRLLLTPCRPVPKAWLGDVSGKKVLALASGGGQQGPLLTALGAKVTVFDFSPAQLAREGEVAAREGYEIALVAGDMTQPLPFPDSQFDLIVHPISNCYIRFVEPVWRECARVLRPGGLLLAGLDNGINFIVDEAEERIVTALPFDPLEDAEQLRRSMAEGSGYQFSHSIDEQIGGQLRAGFRLLDLYEDCNNAGRLGRMRIPTSWATLARKE
ncbi:MAG: class I SAM-dependent methyltransferase [Christensenellales bacterium]